MTDAFWPEHLKNMVDLYAHICSIPEHKSEYWRKCQALAKEQPEIYATLPDLVAERVRAIKEQAQCAT